MIKILYDYLPVVIFYITFKKYGIYMACKVIIATAYKWSMIALHKKWSKMLVTFFSWPLYSLDQLYCYTTLNTSNGLSIAYWSLGLFVVAAYLLVRARY